jgi:hypothetical protein
MGSLATPYISHALSRLRTGVCLCCWVVVLSLITQLLIWGVASFMDVRFSVLQEHVEPAKVISAAAAEREQPLGSPDAHPLESPAEAKSDAGIPSPNPNIMATKYDRIMTLASDLAMSAGTIAMILALPMLMVGVLLASGSATPGVDKVVSAFMWSLVVTMLVLPIGQHIGLPWTHGGLVSYHSMTQAVDEQMADGRWGSATFYGRFCVLPLTCLIGVAMIALRFSGGVQAGIIPKEDMRLDPTLEREAANMKATSLIGGRAGAALRNLTPTAPLQPQSPMANAAQPAPSLTAVTANGQGEIKPGMLQAVAGEAPRRLI